MTSPNHDMIECPFEADVLDALASARWPERVDAGLTQHVASCGICQDVIAVAAAMQDDKDAAWREANVPSSGQMWWRAEMRVRHEAIRAASRPITFAYIAAASIALTLMASVGWFAWPAMHGFLSAIASTQVSELSSPVILPLLVALGALLVVAPVALYLVLSDE